jgi:Tfp pilus assembly protein PilF
MSTPADTTTRARKAAVRNPEDAAGRAPAARKTWSDAALVALLLLMTLICYANILTNSFVYDDDQQVLQNPYVRSWRFLPEIFTTTVWSFVGQAGATNYYRPLMTLSYLVLWKLFGPIPFGFHLFSIVVHAAAVTMVFSTGSRIFHDRRIAWCAALLFAIHPIHTETVDWIAALPDLLSCFFFLAAMWVFVASDKPTWKTQVARAVLFGLALLSKEPALMLVPTAVLYEHFVRPERGTSTLLEKFARYLPLCALGAAYLSLRIALFGRVAPVLQHPQITWAHSVYSAFAMVADYLRLLLWPSKLSAFHVFHASTSLAGAKVLIGIFLVAICLGIAASVWRKSAAAGFSILWIGVTLLPVLNARWMAANVFTERYLYLPSVGFCWLVGWVGVGICDSLVRASPKRPRLIRSALAVGLAVVCILGVLATIARNRVWSDDITLYTHTLETDPDAYPIRLNLGIVYAALNDRQRAEAEYKIALRLRPDGVNALNALGILYLEEHRYDEATRLFKEAMRLKPLWADPYFAYGRLLENQGRNQDALEPLAKSVELAPVNPVAHRFYADALVATGKPAQAEKEYERSIALGPSLEAEHALADLYLARGDAPRAKALLAQAIAENPYDSAAHLKMARLLEREAKLAEAAREYQKTLQTDPNNIEAKTARDRLLKSQPPARK